MFKPPPTTNLPPGAVRWVSVDELGEFNRDKIRQLKSLCSRGLLHFKELAGGYGGMWLAVDAGGWPVTNTEGLKAYKERRQEAAGKAGRAAAAKRSGKTPRRGTSRKRA